MTYLHFLHNADWFAFLTANVTVLYSLYPVYKRTKSFPLVLLGYGYLLGLFVSITDRTIGLSHMVPSEYAVYYTLRSLTYISACALGVTGIVVLLRDFLKLHASVVQDTSEKGESLIPRPVEFLFKVFRKIFEHKKIEVAVKRRSVPILRSEVGSSTVTCPSCGTSWELTSEEESKPVFTCQECSATFEITDI